MSFFSALDISSSGMAVQRKRMEVIARNLANIGVTRDAQGRVNPPPRMVTVPQVGNPEITGSETLGVRVAEVRPDAMPTRLERIPGHPDANADGMVEVPNVEAPVEITHMMLASRAYEANITIIDMTRRMITSTLQILA